MLGKLFNPYIYLSIFIAFFCVWMVGNSVSARSVNLNTRSTLQQQIAVPCQPPYTKLYDLIHTKLEVKFDWEKHQLHGIATVQVRPHFYPQQQLVFDAQDFIIYGVAILDSEEKKEVPYSYDTRQLTITLDHIYTREDLITVEVVYATHSDQDKPKNRFKLTGNQGLFFINHNSQNKNKPQQIWTQGGPNSNSYWFPTIDAPNQHSTQEVYITVEDKFKTLSNGILVYTTLNDDQTRTDYWRMDLPHPPYLFMLAVGEFAEVQDEWNDMPVTYYVEPAYQNYAKTIFKHTTEMLDYFSEKLDYPYPWPKYSQIIVRDYFTGAMQNTTAVVLTEAIQGDERELLDKADREEMIAHELCHHWFGNLVTCESWSQLPLNESFALFGTHLWYDYKYGAYERDRLILKNIEGYLREAKSKQVSVIRNYYNYPIEMFDSHTYQKGTLILHMLKTYLGEEAFLQSLSQYLKKYAFSSTDIHQLRRVFEEVSGQDLNWFFNQWFLSPGHPLLRVEHSYANGKLSLKIWQKQASPTPIYQLPLAVDVWVKGQKERYDIKLDKSYQEFTWSLPGQPELVYIDRNYLLVGEIDHPQNSQTCQYLYRYGEDFFAQYEAIRYFKNNKTNPASYYNFFKDVLGDDYWVFRIMAIEAFRGYTQQEKDYSDIEAMLVMLSGDPCTVVREAALKTLTSLQYPSKYTYIYQNSLEDSSYRVVSAALYAYATYSDQEEVNIKDAVLSNFEDYDDINIITALATYYANTKNPDKYEWLKNKTLKLYTQLGFENLLTYLVQYACALALGAPYQQERTLELLEDILEKNSINRIRLAVHDALQIMPKTKNIKKILSEIKLEE